MHIASRILKLLLAVWYITGGIYMMSHHQELATMWALNSLPEAIWLIIGIFQIVFSLGLVLPGIFKVIPKQITLISSVGLIVISLLGLVLYSAYSGFPGALWAIVPAILVAYIGCKR